MGSKGRSAQVRKEARKDATQPTHHQSTLGGSVMICERNIRIMIIFMFIKKRKIIAIARFDRATAGL